MTRQVTLRQATLKIHGGDTISLVDTAENKVVDEAEQAIMAGRVFRATVDGNLTVVPFHAIVSLVVTASNTTEVEFEDDTCEAITSCGGL